MLSTGYLACGALVIVGLLVWTVGREEDDVSMQWEWALMCGVCALLSFDLVSAPASFNTPASPELDSAAQGSPGPEQLAQR